MTWGKGITVDCGRWIGEWARRAIEGDTSDHRGEEIGEREWLLNYTHAHKKVWHES